MVRKQQPLSASALIRRSLRVAQFGLIQLLSVESQGEALARAPSFFRRDFLLPGRQSLPADLFSLAAVQFSSFPKALSGQPAAMALQTLGK
jgi:hypothetical protein